MIFILPRLNMHSDELRKRREKIGSSEDYFGYYTLISILTFQCTKVNNEKNSIGFIMFVAEV